MNQLNFWVTKFFVYQLKPESAKEHACTNKQHMLDFDQQELVNACTNKQHMLDCDHQELVNNWVVLISLVVNVKYMTATIQFGTQAKKTHLYDVVCVW